MEAMTLERTQFTGVIERDGQNIPLNFAVWAGADSRLLIEAYQLPTQSWLALEPASGEPGSIADTLVLNGVSSNGEIFFSDSVVMRGATFGTNGNSIKLSAGKAEIVVSQPEEVAQPWMRLWFRGFKSRRNPLVGMSLGLVQVDGNSECASHDDVCGHVTVQATADTSLEGWVERANDFLTHMHRGLGFAHGGRLQTPRLDLRIGNRLETTHYQGVGFGKSLPPVHCFNHGPIIEALCRRFDDPQPLNDVLWTAIGWLNSDNPFDEGRFLMSMTALEAIVERLLPKTLSTVSVHPKTS